MRFALLAAALLAAAVCGSRLLAQDGSTGQCANGQCSSGQCGCQQCGCQQCNSGQCNAGGDCQRCAAHCCSKCGAGQGQCNNCGYTGPFAGKCVHCLKGIHSICHHPPHHGNRAALYRSTLEPWHGGYYYTQWGAPVALVIPPNAEMHTDYSWGVPSMRVSQNNHQFRRGIPGGAAGAGGGYGFLPTPLYPSDTNQFGVYYVRGPW